MTDWTIVNRGRPRKAPRPRISLNEDFGHYRRYDSTIRTDHHLRSNRYRITGHDSLPLTNRFEILERTQSRSNNDFRARSQNPDRNGPRLRQFHDSVAHVWNPKTINPRTRQFVRTTNTTQNETRLTEGDRSFVRELYNLIRAIHHLDKISTSRNETPPTLQRLTNMLSSIIKPAMPSESTSQWLDGNARNWAYTTRCILEEHYQFCIDSISAKLKSLQRADWRKLFTIASRWAVRNLGRRMERNTLQKVETLLVSLFEEHIATDSAQIIHTHDDTQPVPDPLSEEEFPPLSRGHITTSPTIRHTPLPRRSRLRRVRGNPNVVDDPSGEFEEIVQIDTNNAKTPTVDKMVHQPLDIPRELPTVTVHREPQTDPHPAQLEQERELLIHGTQDYDSGELISFVDDTPHLTPTRATTMRVQGSVENMIPSDQKSPMKSKPTRHLATTHKIQVWSLSVKKRILIIGDSNLSRIPDFELPDVQIDSYPGATFRHAAAIMEKANIWCKPEKVILSFGINHKTQNIEHTATKQFQHAIRVAREVFTLAEIWVPQIDYQDKSLNAKELKNLWKLNNSIQNFGNFIPRLPTHKFRVTKDGLHWTADTARAMLQHWADYLNF